MLQLFYLHLSALCFLMILLWTSQEETDRIANEIQKKREKEKQEIELEKTKMVSPSHARV